MAVECAITIATKKLEEKLVGEIFLNLRPTWRRVDEAENTPLLAGSEVQESNNQVK